MSKLSPKMWYLLKYGFLALMTAGIFVTVLPVSKPEDGPDWLDSLGENFSEPAVDESFSLSILREDVTYCLTNLRQSIYQEKYTPKTTLNNISTTNDKTTVFTRLTSFINILSLLQVKAILLEPSILYCMLIQEYQELLLKRNFNTSHFSRSTNVITFGILEKDVEILQKEENIYKFTSLKFHPYFVQEPLANWMKIDTSSFDFETFTSHIFYKYELGFFHVVVFYERNNYLWVAGLDSQSNDRIPKQEDLLFADHDSAYEKFSFLSLENNVLPVADFFVPSNIHYFLYEMQSSRFLECNISRATNIFSSNQPKYHPGMSVNRFNRRTRISIRELKKIFHPLLMDFWIWSGTMLGWYRQCDIIPYTTDIDFAAWSFQVDNLDQIVQQLLNNKYLTIKIRFGFLQEALEFQTNCHNLRVDVFFMYPLTNGSWCAGHSPKLGYYFRYFYPPFTLCSAELLGEKVQVPCEAENVIEAEYGTNWSKPTSSWHYENSVRNKGPNIYWEKDRLEKAYHFY